MHLVMHGYFCISQCMNLIKIICMIISELEIRIYPQLQAHRVHPEGIRSSLNHAGSTQQRSHPGQTCVRNSTEICFIHKYSSVVVTISCENVLSADLIIFRIKNSKLVAKSMSIHCNSTNCMYKFSLYNLQPKSHKLLWTFSFFLPAIFLQSCHLLLSCKFIVFRGFLFLRPSQITISFVLIKLKN